MNELHLYFKLLNDDFFWEGLGNYIVYVISNRNASAIFEISKFEIKVHTVDVNIFVMIEFEFFNA